MMTTIPGYDLYNGASPFCLVDGSGAVWRSFYAKSHATGQATFRIFRDGVEVSYGPLCDARGSICADGTYIAYNGSTYVEGVIPGFVRPAGMVAASGGYIRVFADIDGFDGQRDIALASYGVPAAALYQIKVAVDAASAGRTLRAGPIASDPNQQTGGMVTARTVAAGEGQRVYAEAWRAASGGMIRVLTDAGKIDHGFVDITAWQL